MKKLKQLRGRLKVFGTTCKNVRLHGLCNKMICHHAAQQANSFEMVMSQNPHIDPKILQSLLWRPPEKSTSNLGKPLTARFVKVVTVEVAEVEIVVLDVADEELVMVEVAEVELVKLDLDLWLEHET